MRYLSLSPSLSLDTLNISFLALLPTKPLDTLLLPPPSPPSVPSESPPSSDPQPIPLRSITHIQSYLPTLSLHKDRLTTLMETLVFEGLSRLNQPILASSLQTAFNLGLLPSLVRGLLGDLTDAVEGRIKGAFDLASLAREAGAGVDNGYKARSMAAARNEPSSQQAPQWANILWARLGNLIEDMASCCIKVRSLSLSALLSPRSCLPSYLALCLDRDRS
jgi:hypothetical protein